MIEPLLRLAVVWRSGCHRFPRLLGIACCLVACAAVGVPASAARMAEVTVGDLHATLASYDGLMPAGGLKVTYRGMPLITRTSLNVISPDWKRAYFALGRAKADVTVSDLPEGKRLVLTAANDSVSLQYTVDVLEGNRVVLAVEGVARADGPMMMEYAAAYLPAVLMAGQPYEAALAEGTRTGVMPFSSTETDPDAAMVVPPLRRIQVASRMGNLVVEGDSDGAGLDFFDARGMPSAWLQENPVFWLGHTKMPLESGKPFRARVALRLDAREDAERPERPAGSTASPAVQEVDAVRLPEASDGQIIPAPQEHRAGRGAFAIQPSTRIVVGSDPDSRRAAQELQDRLRSDYGLDVRTAPASIWRDRSNVIVVGMNHDPSLRAWLAETDLDMVTRAEGYALRVTPRYALVAGADARGTLYGVFTLLQMTDRAGGTGSPRIAAGTVRDWPATAVRGVHLLTDHWSTFLHRDLIKRVLAPHKINTILLECEYVQWESHPELHVSWGMPKAEVRALLELAREYHIEVIPLVQTLGHVGWMFQNNQHLDLAEDPQARYAYCPSNPKTYALLYDILGEAVELFGKPRYLHIGHDEFTHRGKFGQHAACRGKEISELFLEDTLRLRQFLAGRGVRTMMWGDMILGPGEAADATHARTVDEARSLRERLPKDILITDWHYVAAPEYPSIKTLRDAGFEVWAATWNKPENVRGFAQAAARHGSGLIQTTWTGYYGNPTALRREFSQLWAYLLAAEYSWAPEARPLAEATRMAPRRFAEVWPTRARAAQSRRGFTLDVAALANMPWQDDAARSGWLGYGPDHDLSALPTGRQQLGAFLFYLPENRKAVGLSSPLLPMRYPKSVAVPVGRRASQLMLLLASGWEAGESENVGQIVVRYADGTSMPVDLLYGWNVRAVHDPRPAFQAPVVWQGQSAGGDALYLRAFTLWNPFPTKPVVSIEMVAGDTAAAPILLAVSGVE